MYNDESGVYIQSDANSSRSSSGEGGDSERNDTGIIIEEEKKENEPSFYDFNSK